MQLPDETVTYDYRNLLAAPPDEWTLLAELKAKHFLSQQHLKNLLPRLMQVRSQIVAERELKQAPAELQPLHAGFIDLPQNLLSQYRRESNKSELGKILAHAEKMRQEADAVVVLGIGGSYLGARALFDALRSSYHNELPGESRLGIPRIYFEGNNVDNDALQELLDLLEVTCVEPNRQTERWGVIVISKSGGTIETAAALRVFRREAAEYYGSKSERLKQLFAAVTGQTGKLRDLFKEDGHKDEDILTIPDDVGGRYSIFTSVGLLPAAVMGIDVRALLLGASAMTKRFIDEPFERNPVLQYAAVNYLMYSELGKPLRVMSIWSKKLEAVGLWYDQLLAESLGKFGGGPTPISTVQTRDLHSRGQQHQEGPRDRVINNLIVTNPRHVPIPVGMADRNEDDLNALSRKTYPDLMNAALQGTNKAYMEVARPTSDIVLPTLSEFTMGQLFQMLMLATVVEGRLMGVNPYGQPGVEAYKRNMKAALK